MICRRFQFRLRTLMIGVTLLAVPLGYVGWQAKIVASRMAMKDEIAFPKGFIDRTMPIESERDISWFRKFLGDEAVRTIWLPVTTNEEYRRRVNGLFPEADVLAYKYIRWLYRRPVPWPDEPRPRD